MICWKKHNTQANRLNSSWKMNLRNYCSESIDHFLKTIVSIRIVLDDRHTYSTADELSESWPLEPLALQELDFHLTFNHFRFFGPKFPRNFFTQQTPNFLEDLIQQRSALPKIDGVFLVSHSKSLMLQLIKQILNVATGGTLKLAPE